MKAAEKIFMLWTICYLIVYGIVFCYFAVCETTGERRAPFSFEILIPFHLLGMAQNFTALILTIRDLYKRSFPNENAKLTWLLLILCTGGIGWLVYVFKHAFKPRPIVSTDGPVR